MERKVGQVLISEEELAAMCRRVADAINRDYAGREVLLIGVLKGAFVFLADLVRLLDIDCQVDFLAVSSYGGVHSTGVVRINKDVDVDLSGKHVILVEDIIDSGLTLVKLKELLLTRNPASLAICTAFNKPHHRVHGLEIDYSGMDVPDAFIVGYGLDFDGRYRQLPAIYELVPVDEDLTEE